MDSGFRQSCGPLGAEGCHEARALPRSVQANPSNTLDGTVPNGHLEPLVEFVGVQVQHPVDQGSVVGLGQQVVQAEVGHQNEPTLARTSGAIADLDSGNAVHNEVAVDLAQYRKGRSNNFGAVQGESQQL
jgi:hypothetical protein